MALSKGQVLRTAVGILDAYGLADLTMRRLADALGVRAGALYWHYPNKQTLLAAIADVILTESFESSESSTSSESSGVDADSPGEPTPPWPDAVSAWALGLRSALLAHRDSADLVSSTRAMGLVTVDVAGPAAAHFASAGLPDAEARAAAQALVRYVLGHVAEEQTQADFARLGPSRAPASEMAVPHHHDRVDAASFAFGVRLLLDGVRAAAGAPTPRPG